MPLPIRSSLRRPTARVVALGAVLLLAACATGGPAEVPGTPAEKRLAVVKGTTPGIVIIPARTAPAAEATPAIAPATTSTAAPTAAVPSTARSTAAAAAAAAPTPTAAPAAAAAPARSAEPGTGFSFRRLLGGLGERLGPPTGRPLAEQKKLDAPDQGIPLPSAGAGASK